MQITKHKLPSVPLGKLKPTQAQMKQIHSDREEFTRELL